MSSNVLIITGMHRSGSSLTAHWIQKMGINMGDRLMIGDFSNPDGHFEDLDFVRAHQEVLTDLEKDPQGLTNIGRIQLSTYHQAKLEHLIKLKSSLRDEWGWKDPRTSLFLDYYKLLLPDAKKLFLFRDYRVSVDSLLRRTLMGIKYNYSSRTILHMAKFLLTKQRIRRGLYQNTNKYLDAWIVYNTNIIKCFKESGDKALLLTTDDFIKADYKIYSKIAQWGFKLKYVPFSSVYKDELLNKSVRSNFNINPALRAKAEEITAELRNCNDESKKTIHIS